MRQRKQDVDWLTVKKRHLVCHQGNSNITKDFPRWPQCAIITVFYLYWNIKNQQVKNVHVLAITLRFQYALIRPFYPNQYVCSHEFCPVTMLDFKRSVIPDLWKPLARIYIPLWKSYQRRSGWKCSAEWQLNYGVFIHDETSVWCRTELSHNLPAQAYFQQT